MLKAGGKCSGGAMNSCIPQNMSWQVLSKTSLLQRQKVPPILRAPEAAQVAYQEGNPWEAALDVSKQSFLSSSFFHLK